MCSRLKFRDPLPLTPLTDLNCMEDPCERVHVGETVWNFVLVIGLLDCGTMDTLIAFALMVGNAMMQALFCIAIMSPRISGHCLCLAARCCEEVALGCGPRLDLHGQHTYQPCCSGMRK